MVNKWIRNELVKNELIREWINEQMNTVIPLLLAQYTLKLSLLQ